jgi:YgiT-type zinc finger domain-containing protein
MTHNYGDCIQCGGVVTERLMRKPCFWGDALVAVVENVPTGVCEQCGERYYHAQVLRDVEGILERRPGTDKIEVPLFAYS